MKPFFAYSLFVLFIILLTSWANAPLVKTLLWAKFETESPGSLPNKNLSGTPPGDAMTYSKELEPALKVVAEKLQDKQALEFSNIKFGAEVSGHGHWLSFQAAPTELDKVVTFTWTGKPVHNIYGSDIYMQCSLEAAAGGSISMIQLRINRDGDLLVQEFGKDYTQKAEIKIGSVGFGEKASTHTVFVNINIGKTASSYKVTLMTPESGIVGQHTGIIEWKLQDMKQNGNKPSLSFSYQDNPGDPTKKYLIDGIVIQQ